LLNHSDQALGNGDVTMGATAEDSTCWHHHRAGRARARGEGSAEDPVDLRSALHGAGSEGRADADPAAGPRRL